MRVLVLLVSFLLASCSKNDIELSQGDSLSSKSLEEKTVVLNIWADWCPPCIVEMPYFNKLNEQEDIVVLGFHFDQFDVLETTEVIKLLQKFDVKFRNMKTDPRDIWGMEIPVHVPTTYIIRNNEIIKTLITPQTYESLIQVTKI
jgi:thiol-disulfide isomerase/thioredoxin|tara:strand:- start:1369 stop:1803 length:435 start_codon:yes stop_codon:yes gene_type:complete